MLGSAVCYRGFSQILSLKNAWNKKGRHLKPEDLCIINNGAIVFDKDKILWCGKEDLLPEKYHQLKSFLFPGKILTPELVDSHTHLLFGGNRSDEYVQRLNGIDYQEIANSGGGILSTVKATNDLSRNALFELSCQRIETINSYGVGTIEIKSGYGLNLEKEKELTLIINQLKKHFAPAIQIFNTYMAAHAIAPGFDNSNDYMDQVVLPLLNQLAAKKIIDAVDIFHEKNYFNQDDVIKLFELAKKLGIARKIHADEFQDNGGASLAVKYGALSADHLLQTGEQGIKDLVNSQTIATLLPGTGYFLGKNQVVARKFLDQGGRVNIASDFNPGSCHFDHLLFLASLVAPTYKLNQCELWSSITLNAAAALGLDGQGALIEGLKPRFSLFEVENINEISYCWGKNFHVPGFHQEHGKRLEKLGKV